MSGKHSHVHTLEKDENANHTHSCSCSGNCHSESSEFSKAEMISAAFGILFYIAAFIFGREGFVRFALFFTAYILFGWNVILTAVKNIFKGNLFDENFLMSLATIGAFYINEYPDAVAVMLLYKIGEYFQSKAVGKSRKSIKSLLTLMPEFANIEKNGKIVKTDPTEVEIGDVIIVLSGEKIPIDGVIIEGKSQLDTSSLTGEALPLFVGVDDQVMSGSINLDGTLRIRTETLYTESTVAKILTLVENASSKKAPTEKFITRFSKVYTPVVVIFAVLLVALPMLFIKDAVFADWLKRALVFLVVSCPCALVISVPLTFFSGIGFASKNGILVKGGNYLQKLSKADTVVFDKTGTLTTGVISVDSIVTEGSMEKEKLLEIAYCLEQYSNHPLSRAIKNEFQKNAAECSLKVSDLQEIAGQGVKGNINDDLVFCGNKKLLESEGILVPNYSGSSSVVYVAVNGICQGFITLSDTLKEDAAKAVTMLSHIGIEEIVMLTGDRKAAAAETARKAGITDYHAELLPHGKVEAIEQIYAKKPGSTIVFAGDGINDAPVLARSDIGFAMGGVGSDAAIEAADVIVMNNEPSKIADAISISKATMRIVKQNIILALSIKLLVMSLSVFGFSNLELAVFADVGVCLIVVLNSLRVQRTRLSSQ